MSVSFANIAAACVALQSGKAAKPDFMAYAKSEKHDTQPMLKLFVDKVLTMDEINEIIKAHQDLAAASANKPAGQLYCKLALKGGISIYGINRMPVTLYAEQAERLVKWLGAPAENPISKLIASKPTREFSLTELTEDYEKAYLAEVLAGKHPHAKIVGDKLVVSLASKPAKS